MSEPRKLIDPNLPWYEIIKGEDNKPILTDKGKIQRNDGILLTPAKENIWYQLATIAGELTDENRYKHSEIQKQNARYWNGWWHRPIGKNYSTPLGKDFRLTRDEEAIISNKLQHIQSYPSSIDFTKIYCENIFDLSDFIFPNDASFRNATFHQDTTFSKATFQQAAYFSDATFVNGAYFSDATFTGNATFMMTSFIRGANFHASTFNRDTNFSNAAFYGFVNFNKANFNQLAYFDNARFNKHAHFDMTTFNRDTRFDNVTFNENAHFHSAVFNYDINFDTAIFNQEAIFDKTIFNRFSSFDHAIFNRFSTFSNAIFKHRTHFDSTIFKENVPAFFETTIYQDTSFTTNPKNWPDESRNGIETTEANHRAYARLRQIMNSQQRPRDELFFYRQEMRCEGRLEERRLYRWMNALFGLISNYGYSALRPAATFIAFGLFCCALYILCYIPPAQTIYSKILGNNSCQWDNWDRLALSFSNMLPYLGLTAKNYPKFHECIGAGFELLTTVQFLVGGLLLFLFALGLRNRFRLK